jgi:hypothetical protein
MLDIHFRTCLLKDVANVQRLVDDLFEAYPPEDGLSPTIIRTYNEFMRFP